jgi:hypothetical protein
MKDKQAVGMLVIAGLGIWALSKAKPAIAAPEVIKPLAQVEAKTTEFWKEMSGIEQIYAIAPEAMAPVEATALAIEARKQAYLNYPIGLAQVPEEAPVLAKTLASTADAVKASEAQAQAGLSPKTIEWWQTTQAVARARDISTKEAYYLRTGEEATFDIPPVPAY